MTCNTEVTPAMVDAYAHAFAQYVLNVAGRDPSPEAIIRHALEAALKAGKNETGENTLGT